MRTKAIKQDSLNAILRALTPQNRLVCLTSLATGLRVSDVLNIKTNELQKGRFTVRESKTGKLKKCVLPNSLIMKILPYSGSVYAFPHRSDGRKHRTRQAVWHDLHRVSKIFKLTGVAPHSMRKTYAHTLREEGLTDYQIQKALNHSSPIITQLYLMADELGIK